MSSNSAANLKISVTTENLELKTLTHENASPHYFDWLQDPQVTRFLEVRHLNFSSEEIQNFINYMFEDKNNILFGIFVKNTQKHIGNIKLGPINWVYSRADIGLLIGDKEYWGKGFATEAIEAVVKVAQENLNIHRLQAGAYASNIGSIKAFKKANFDQEGLLKDYWSIDGEYEDEILLARILKT